MNQEFLAQKKGIGLRHHTLVQPEGMIKEIRACRINGFKLLFFIIGSILTLGFLYLLSRWEIKVWLKCLTSATSVQNAQYFVVFGQDGSSTIVPSKRLQNSCVMMEFRLYRYVFDDNLNQFEPLETEFTQLKNKDLIDQYYTGIGETKEELENKYGLNNTEIPDKGVMKTLIDQVLSPFYIFQFCSVILWYNSTYAKYATVILITSILSIMASLQEQRTSFKRLQKLSRFQIDIKVLRKNKLKLDRGKVVATDRQNIETLSSLYLLPGDLIEIEDNMTMPCDAVLLNGQCIYNESMLTGESIPVLKTPVNYSNVQYNPNDEGKQCTLFAGTICLEAKIANKANIPVVALVTQTAFNTMKGQLIRSIMFPVESNFKFYADSMKFVGVMAALAVVGFMFTLPNKIQTLMDGDISTWDFIAEGLDLITITVPPALPTCLQIGVSIALSRLQQCSIFCISPPKINISGKITVMCFDKTGTLTEEGLDLYGLRPIGLKDKKIRFFNVFKDCNQLIQQANINYELLEKRKETDQNVVCGKDFVEIMASCHGLAWVKGQLIGDPLEVKMFESTEWRLDEGEDQNILARVTSKKSKPKISSDDISLEEMQSSILVYKRFEFSSKLQRMAVVVRSNKPDAQFKVHVKGSPEKLRELCLKRTIPNSFHKILDFYAQNGFRVLAIGSKVLPKLEVDDLAEFQREDAECGLTFLGFIVMQNKLKEITSEIIEELQEAHIRSIMVTGDNVLTAISVARQCNIIHQNQRVYLGDLSEKKQNGQYRVVWKDFEQNSLMLNPDNLNPQGDLLENESENDLQVAEDLREEGLMIKHTHLSENEDYTKFMAKNPSLLEEPPPAQQQLEIANVKSCISRASRRRKSSMSRKNSYFSNNEEEEYEALDDKDVHEEEVLPWKNDTDNYVLAISGGAFTQILQSGQKQLIRQVLEYTQVYARMRPEEKANLMKQLQELDRKPLVGFCGDGANDCGALKGADVGVSLSQAEASIAAPFTSNIQDISCIPIVLRQGRSALTTSFQCFKFMALYSMIQFSQVTILYLKSSNLTDNQYLYNDLITIFPLSITMGFTQACSHLNKYVPGSSLISLPVLASVIGQTVIQIGFQLGMYFLLLSQPWFMTTYEVNEGDINDDSLQVCYENTTLFLFGNYQYIATVIAFSTGQPFRKSFYTNIYLITSIVGLMVLNTFLLFTNYEWSVNLAGLRFDVVRDGETISQMPQSWINFIAIASLVNAAVTITFDRYIIPIIQDRKLKKQQQVNPK